MVVSLSEQIVTVVLHCLALLKLVSLFDSYASLWEELVLLQVHYLIVALFCAGGVLIFSSVSCIFCIFSRSLRFPRSSVLELMNTVKEYGATLVFTMLVPLHLFFIGSCI